MKASLSRNVLRNKLACMFNQEKNPRPRENPKNGEGLRTPANRLTYLGNGKINSAVIGISGCCLL